jgi:hypothetical protein
MLLAAATEADSMIAVETNEKRLSRY